MEYENDRFLHRKQFLGSLVEQCHRSGKMNRAEYSKKVLEVKNYTDVFQVENDIILFKALANNRDAKPMP